MHNTYTSQIGKKISNLGLFQSHKKINEISLNELKDFKYHPETKVLHYETDGLINGWLDKH